jgi:hypothetical protein
MGKKVKVILVIGTEGTQGCETSRFPPFLCNQITGGDDVVTLCAGSALSPGIFLVLISITG